MNHPQRPLLAVLALTALAGTAFALSMPSAPAAPQDHEEHEEGGPLHEAMEHIKGAMRRLGKVLPAGDVPVALDLVADIQGNVLTAKGQTPHLAEQQAGAEKERFLAEYRATLAKALRLTCDLELALLEGRAEDAGQAFEELRGMEKPAHERFRDAEEQQ